MTNQSLSSCLAMLPTAIFGSLAHIRHGTMRAAYAFPLGAGCLLGNKPVNLIYWYILSYPYWW